MSYEPLATFSARDAKTRFGEVLDEALGHPVGITRHERLTAYIVSKKEFEGMRERVRELEDQLWLLRAEAARAEGFASDAEVEAFLDVTRNSSNEAENKQAGSEGH